MGREGVGVGGKTKSGLGLIHYNNAYRTAHFIARVKFINGISRVYKMPPPRVPLVRVYKSISGCIYHLVREYRYEYSNPWLACMSTYKLFNRIQVWYSDTLQLVSLQHIIISVVGVHL